ncbi:MAG: hypothetical protein Q8K30_05865 [Candidatus Gracilibacteria bacterium]|nr:hypothetical protein [Candidatus Gracilibacteria bacterium]
MKYLFSFFMLLVYVIIGIFQTPMITFAMQENIIMEMNMHHHQKVHINELNDCCLNNSVDDKDCNHECCFKSDRSTISNIVNIGQKDNKKEKIQITYFLDIFAVSINSFSNKSLLNKTSPPNINRDIKNYSYIDLIKIIKSNI